MLDVSATLSPHTDQSTLCIDCGGKIVLTRSQDRNRIYIRKRCDACNAEVSKRRCYARFIRIRAENPLAAMFSCKRCGGQVQRQGRNHKHCGRCADEIVRERHAAYEKRVYERKRKGKPRLGDKIQCAACGTDLIRTAPLKRFCKGCLRALQRDNCKKARNERLGISNPGTIRECACCSGQFVTHLSGNRLKYCEECRASTGPALLRMKARRKVDPAFVLRGAISGQIWKALKGRKRFRKSETLLGYTMAKLKDHLERQFSRGMSWENYGKWHLDHIIPLARLPLNDDADIRAAWALSNLRPLWKRDNETKHATRTLHSAE